MIQVISLNIWGGRAGKEGVLNFFEAYRDSTDVFCLQEAWSAPHHDFEGVFAGGRVLKNDDVMVYAKQEIGEVLSDFIPIFHPHFRDNYGLLMFVRKKFPVVSEGEEFVYLYKGYEPESPEEIGNHARNVQYATIETKEGRVTIVNFHGLWNGRGKTDCAERLRQSDKIIQFIKTIDTPIVLCGDFNLLPDTESIRKLEVAGLRNLILEYDITSTRTSYYTKPEKFADYVFVSQDIAVQNFEVLPEEVSDHVALRLTFGLQG